MSIPTPAVISVAPIIVPTENRPAPLEVRVTAPVVGEKLPVILLAHGLGHSNDLSSLNGYAPLASRWAAAGFAVVQPTHLDSRTRHLAPGDPQLINAWRTRVEDMTRIIDHLAEIEHAVPGLAGRLDHNYIAVAGHSMGGHTAGLLLGLSTTDPTTGSRVTVRDHRITAGIILAAPGRGGDVLTPFAAEHLGFLNGSDFSTMTAPALVVVGDEDASAPLNTEGPDWLTDSYRRAPSPKTLLTLHGAGHILGGISGWDTLEAADERPAHVAVVAEAAAAYLRTQFAIDRDAWTAVADEVESGSEHTVEAK